MSKKICENCQYFRKPMTAGRFTAKEWCGNSKSPNGARYTNNSDTCAWFVKRGEKAPFWMRLLAKATR